MKNYSQSLHFFSQKEDFEQGVIDLLHQSKECRGAVSRITIFGKCPSDEEFEQRADYLERAAIEVYGEQAPMVSYVTQPVLLDAEFVAEVQIFDVDVEFKQLDGLRYIILDSDHMKRLVVCGVRGSVKDSIRKQSDDLFAKISKVFAIEGFEVSDIFRQWNYIPKITAVDSDNYQHYQAFNDSRTDFYRAADWSERGYPAATGIGMDCGAVVVDLIAVKLLDSYFRIIPVDNDLQCAAHVYSQGVLIGAEGDVIEGKSTPKFERAKALGSSDEGYICFISGTAAIRGEESNANDDAAVQTVQTMENIEHLMSDHTCNIYNVKYTGCERSISVSRAYIKYPEDAEIIKSVVEERWPETSVVYLLADVCRDELLVEIEAVSSISF